MVVSNSAYANEEIPVDLILADIATKNGWKLKEIGVLREIRKRKTKYSPDIETLRESVIILEKDNLRPTKYIVNGGKVLNMNILHQIQDSAKLKDLSIKTPNASYA